MRASLTPSKKKFHPIFRFYHCSLHYTPLCTMLHAYPIPSLPIESPCMVPLSQSNPHISSFLRLPNTYPHHSYKCHFLLPSPFMLPTSYWPLLNTSVPPNTLFTPPPPSPHHTLTLITSFITPPHFPLFFTMPLLQPL